MSDEPEKPDLTHIAQAAYTAYAECERAKYGCVLPQWSELTESQQSTWFTIAQHVLQTWLHTTFRATLADDEVVKAAGALAKVARDQGDSAVESFRHMLAYVPLMLIDAPTLRGESGEVFLEF